VRRLKAVYSKKDPSHREKETNRIETTRVKGTKRTPGVGDQVPRKKKKKSSNSCYHNQLIKKSRAIAGSKTKEEVVPDEKPRVGGTTYSTGEDDLNRWENKLADQRDRVGRVLFTRMGTGEKRTKSILGGNQREARVWARPPSGTCGERKAVTLTD